MEQTRLNEIASILNTKGVRLPCPRCGQLKFSIVGESYISIQETPGTFVIGGPTIPTIIVACDNCGYVTQHAKGPLGLMKGVQK
jgi:uncharacterized Zn finger protein